MFKSATLRLTGWYLAIVMALSLCFSFVIYQNSAHELDSGLRRQGGVFRQMPMVAINGQVLDFDQLRQAELEQGKRHLRANLLNLNLLILLVAGFGSYFLARRTLRPIEEAVEAQGRFTADASHELRTPLTAMKSEIEVALRDPKLKTAEARTLLESNLEEIEKLQALSDGLLKLANSGEGAHISAPVSVALVGQLALRRAQKQIKQSHARVTVSLPDVQVMGDKDSLSELLLILIDNAIKYSGEDKRIEVSGKASSRQVTLTVLDYGPGIKAADLPHVFSRFYRADSSRTKRQVGGYGLGLAIAKQIVDLHHGTITVASAPGHGTKFTIKLPVLNPPGS